MSSTPVPGPQGYELTIDELNRVRYYGRDFFTIFDDMMFRLQTSFFATFNNFVLSDPAMMMVDITCWALDILSFYLDRRATESYLTTARTRDAVSKHTRLIGYQMYSAVPAVIDWEVELTQAWPFAVTIPTGFKFDGPNKRKWQVTGGVVYAPGDVGPKTISGREGEERQVSIVSSGTPNQVFDLAVDSGQKVSWRSLNVQVGVALWSEVEFIPYEKTNVYEVNYNTSPPVVKFGTGLAGNVPASGATITIKYFVTHGTEGGATSEQEWDPTDPLVVAGNTIDMTITNPNPSSKGSDQEDVVHAKTVAPGKYAARSVNITKKDYIGRSRAYVSSIWGAVAQATAYSPRSAAGDLELMACLTAIRAAISTNKPLLMAALSDAVDDVASAQAELASIDAHMAEIIAQVASLNTSLGTIKTNANDAKGHASIAGGSASSSATQASGLKATLAGIPNFGADSLLPVTNAVLQGICDAIIGVSNTATMESGQVDSLMSAIVSNVLSSEGFTSIIGSEVSAAQVDSADASAVLTDAQTKMSEAGVYADDLDSGVEGGITCVKEHMDEVLSNDCKANIVTVPILMKDVDGFYTAPTASLMTALKAYLDQNKEVTQTVNVVSGAPAIVAAEIEIELGVIRGYVAEEIVASAERNVLNLLRDRAFGLSLYQSEVHDVIDWIEGVDWTNVKINGPVTHLDSDGNLLVQVYEVVTRGALSISYRIVDPVTGET